jgi:hypothetical protein
MLKPNHKNHSRGQLAPDHPQSRINVAVTQLRGKNDAPQEKTQHPWPTENGELSVVPTPPPPPPEPVVLAREALALAGLDESLADVVLAADPSPVHEFASEALSENEIAKLVAIRDHGIKQRAEVVRAAGGRVPHPQKGYRPVLGEISTFESAQSELAFYAYADEAARVIRKRYRAFFREIAAPRIAEALNQLAQGPLAAAIKSRSAEELAAFQRVKSAASGSDIVVDFRPSPRLAGLLASYVDLRRRDPQRYAVNRDDPDGWLRGVLPGVK